MRATALQEKQDEEVAFAKFHVWCDGTTKRKQQSVAEAAELIDQLQVTASFSPVCSQLSLDLPSPPLV